MKVRSFLDEIWNQLSTEWQSLFEEERVPWKRFMRTRFFHFWPRPNGRWSAAPQWDEAFSWAACPVDKVRCIVITMRPIRPGCSYKSIGYALGVKRRPRAGHNSNISEIPTVWNALHLVYAVEGVEWTQDVQMEMRDKFRNGFDPREITRQKGVLFVQLQPVAGPANSATSQDRLYFWAGRYTIPLIEAIGRQNAAAGRDPIKVIQLYNNWLLEERLDQAVGLNVFRPSFMDSNARPKISHIKAFNDDCFRRYVDEISADRFEDHRQIFADIFDIIKNHYEDVSFTDKETLTKGKIKSAEFQQ